MSIESNYVDPPQQTNCLEVRLPVVLAEAEHQVTIDTTFCMPELAKKVDHIDAMVMNLEADPVFIHQDESSWSISMEKKWPYYKCHKHHHPGRAFVKKVIVHGILHKQIYYVNQNDEVKHVGEDIPFTKMIDLHEPEPVMDIDNVEVTFRRPRCDMNWDLVRASRLQQTAVVVTRIKICEERNIYIQTCPSMEDCTGKNVLRDPGVEHWVGDIPVGWGATNVSQVTTPVHGGSYAVLLGTAPGAQAAIFQTIRGVRPHRTLRLCVWAAQAPLASGTTASCSYNLTASVIYYNWEDDVLAHLQQQWSSTSIGTAFSQLCFDAGPPPEDVSYARIFVAFRPTTTANNCSVIVDDVTLVCVR